ncbi:MAG: DNA polymerase III subunit beta [Deltaproteobacteria bacterium]|jgi:DNA polymerase-3 subunit beta|nr:DNA polymerase III subunit beta [Deltaproteobacteria bacterium]
MLKAKVKNDEFQKGLSQTSNIAGKFTSMPILSNVLLQTVGGKLILNATDLETTFQAEYLADVISEGKLAIPAKTLNDISHSLDSSEVLDLEELDNFTLEVKGGAFKTNIYGMSPDEFPRSPQLENLPLAQVKSSDLLDAISKTSYSVTTTNTNYNLAGIFWITEEVDDAKVLHLVSSDSNRLNITTLTSPTIADFDGDRGLITSRKGLMELKLLAETSESIQLAVNISSLVAKTDNSLLMIRLLEGNFPDYRKLIPPSPTITITLNRREFIDTLRRMTLLTTNKFKVIYFKFTQDNLNLSTHNPELGLAEENVAVQYEGEELTIGFEPRHLMDPILNLKSERFQIEILDANRPVIIKGADDPGYMGILTTVKINK